jgi:two-component system NtrC family sensor kinase
MKGSEQSMGEASARETLKERVKELECLYGISHVLGRAEMPIGVLLQEIADILPRGFHYPELAGARICIGTDCYQSAAFCQNSFLLSAPVAAGGTVEIAYPPWISERDPSPFLPEETGLIEKAAADISRTLERIRATEEKARLEEQLRHADRLATVGVLAAGVAHELNEPLSTILGFAQLVLKAAALSPAQTRDVERIVEASLRAREIVRNLLIFGGNAPAKTEECDLAAIVRDGIRFLEPRCKSSGIDLHLELVEGGPAVRADPARLTQVLVNLVVNALQAMPAGGSLAVRTHADGRGAVLIVEDSGIGMSAETMNRIFVPFFTTKGTRGGSGLGLAVVHGIVASLGGTIAVHSEVGRGSRFEVRLPRADGAEARP